jgi:phosphohistidine phosphatase
VADPERRLIVLRHAKSAWPEGVADHDRPLASRGRRDAPAAGRWLRESGFVPDRVLCSTAQRARETWQLAEEKLGARPQTVFEPRVYGATSAELLDLARESPPGVRTLLIVGHDPAMQELTLELASAQPGDQGRDALGQVRIKFPTAAIAVLAFTGSWAKLGPGQAQLADFAVPGDFRARHDG